MMKKLLPLLFIGILVAVGSCKKCYVCTRPNSTASFGVDTTYQTERCNKGSYSDGQSFNDAIKSLEANGYNCVPK